MNPNRPRLAGLPTGPASRLVARPRPDQPPTSYTREYTPTHTSSSSWQSNSRSLASLTSSRETTQTSSQFRRANSARDHGREAKYSKPSDTYSTSSEVSSISSFPGRMSGDRAGYESSRTSLEEDYDPPKRGRAEVESLRKGVGQSSQENSKSTEGEGYSLWNQVVTVASTLSVNVGKAWANNVQKFDGEETPPGEDSRLTRAMKAYHLDKARDPSDLPDWLFEEHERRPIGRSRFRPDPRTNATDHEDVEQPRHLPRSRSLHDAYSSTTSSASLRSEAGIDSSRYPGSGPSKPTNRLKELRLARAASSRHDGSSGNFDRRFDGDVDRRPGPRVGLPSGPAVSRPTPRRF